MGTTIAWNGSSVRFLDQTKLPIEEKYITTDDPEVMLDAIRTLKIRGAPLLGIAAAYTLALYFKNAVHSSFPSTESLLADSMRKIAETRPTAKNLFWALERIGRVVRLNPEEKLHTLFDMIVREAHLIHEEDRSMCDAIGRHGESLIPPSARILTHCNTGALATGGIGTALGIIHTASRAGKKVEVFVDETRPLWQGGRLTMWELQKLNIPATLITDNSAAWTLQSKKIDLIIVGADRIAANGDTANKIGTYQLSILARHFGIPMYIAAPTTTIDFSIQTGKDIVVEERSSTDLHFGVQPEILPSTAATYLPAFDVTPHEFITALITEKGILQSPTRTVLETIRP